MRDEAISKTEQLFSLRVFKLMLVTGLLLLAGGIVRAQENTVTQQKGFQAGSSYAISDIESINTLNGNVMLSVPLGSLPSGRGGSSAGIGLMYNSKLWDVIEGVSRTGCGMNPDCQGIPYRFIARGEGGWRYNTRYELKNLGESVSTNLNAGDINFGVCNQSSVDLYRYVVVTPDGGQHELFISTPLESFHGNNGGLTYDLDGTPISSNCWNSTLSRPPAGTVMSYYTLDGTFLRLDVTVLSGNALNWVLRMPNGGRVEVTSGVSGQKIYDRNNNYVLSEQILNYNGTGHAATKLSDQLGRETVIEIGAGPDEDWIYSRGFNNELLTTKVKWKKLYVNRTYYAIPGGVSSIKSFFKEQRVVESITLPSQTSGLQYRFAYNANDTNSSSLSTGWGELSSVTLPSGAVSAYSYKQDNSAQNVLAYDIVHNSPTQKTLTYQDEND
ncbi:MAG: hypothetical protein ACRD6X_20980, partial [Pyrinomonadaceae bacterium]